MRSYTQPAARLNFGIWIPDKEMLDALASDTLRSRSNTILTLIQVEYRSRYPHSGPHPSEESASIQAGGLGRG